MGEGAAGAFGDAPGGGVEVFGVPGIDVRPVMIRAEFQIGDRQAHLQKHGLVEGLDLPHFRRDGPFYLPLDLPHLSLFLGKVLP